MIFVFLHIQLEKSRIDPNDPRNLDFFELMESLPNSAVEDFFRLVDMEDVQRFITNKDFNSNKRFTLLAMRDEGVLCVSCVSECQCLLLPLLFLLSIMDSLVKLSHSPQYMLLRACGRK